MANLYLTVISTHPAVAYTVKAEGTDLADLLTRVAPLARNIARNGATITMADGSGLVLPPHSVHLVTWNGSAPDAGYMVSSMVSL